MTTQPLIFWCRCTFGALAVEHRYQASVNKSDGVSHAYIVRSADERNCLKYYGNDVRKRVIVRVKCPYNSLIKIFHRQSPPQSPPSIPFSSALKRWCPIYPCHPITSISSVDAVFPILCVFFTSSLLFDLHVRVKCLYNIFWCKIFQHRSSPSKTIKSMCEEETKIKMHYMSGWARARRWSLALIIPEWMSGKGMYPWDHIDPLRTGDVHNYLRSTEVALKKPISRWAGKKRRAMNVQSVSLSSI